MYSIKLLSTKNCIPLHTWECEYDCEYATTAFHERNGGSVDAEIS